MNKDNVIDMTDRMQQPDQKSRLKNLKVRLDLEQAKIAVSTSLLSILVLVTIANSRLASQDTPQIAGGRAIASVANGTSEVEDTIVHSLADRALSSDAVIGRKPSSIEQLSFGFLEGKYALHMQNGKLSEIEFANSVDSADRPKHIDDPAQFLEANREVLPVAFSRSVKVEHLANKAEIIETYQLVNEISRPVANVQFRMDTVGRLLSMKVATISNVASK